MMRQLDGAKNHSPCGASDNSETPNILNRGGVTHPLSTNPCEPLKTSFQWDTSLLSFTFLRRRGWTFLLCDAAVPWFDLTEFGKNDILLKLCIRWP